MFEFNFINTLIHAFHFSFPPVAAQLLKLNTDQHTAAKAVLDAVEEWSVRRELTPGDLNVENKSSVFFIEGPAGTGKTTTYKAIYDVLTAQKKKVVCMAFTGSAACLLPNGRTCHNVLRLPVPLTEESVSALEPGYDQ
jgi:Cdc6-like AAA superfamily ATPase